MSLKKYKIFNNLLNIKAYPYFPIVHSPPWNSWKAVSGKVKFSQDGWPRGVAFPTPPSPWTKTPTSLCSSPPSGPCRGGEQQPPWPSTYEIHLYGDQNLKTFFPRFFLFLHQSMCCDHSSEPSRRDGSDGGHKIYFHREVREIFRHDTIELIDFAINVDTQARL